MKRTITILLAVLMLLPAAVLAADAVPSAQVLSLSLLNQDPDPVEPGNYVELRWLVTSAEYADAKNVTFEIQPEYPFSLPAGVSAIQNFPKILANPDEDESIILYYKLRVDDSALEGTEQVKLRYKIGDSTWRQSSTDFDVRVRTYDSYISISDITAEPEVLEPGQSSVVKLKLSNKGDTTITDLKTTLDVDAATIPFSPIGSSNEKFVSSVKKDATAVVEFVLAAEPEAAAGLYKIPITLKYNDVNGESYTDNKVFSLILGSTPEVTVVLEDTDILSAGSKGAVTVKFVNKGLTDLKFLNMKLMDSSDYNVLSAGEVYIGNVDSDDFETAEYKLYVYPTENGEISLPIKYSYRDANNKIYSHETQLQLRLYSKDELKKYGLSGKRAISPVVIILILAVVGYFGWRYYKKRKKASKE